ncbi:MULTISPECIES: hypothetical protein [Falsihalocynthiibacter]|uniref:hypothetical protein n=1 Tax=Falsihalocynthiibacter TaxID=2854182 RepID=UPI003003609B
MSIHQDISQGGTDVSNGTADAKNKVQKRFRNVVVKRERLFNLLQEEHLKERLAAQEENVSKDTPSAGVFRLYGTGPLPEVKPMAAENDDPTSQGVVTFR